MKKPWILLIVVIIGCNHSQQKQHMNTNEPAGNSSLKNSDSSAVVGIVEDFFKAFDEKDLQKINNLLLPSYKIIHYNGVTTSTDEMIKIIKETKNWWPRTRKLSDFEFMGNADMAVVGVLNEVTFSLPENKKVEERYKETWIFRKTGTQWKAIRCHYSKIIVDKHSEEVN